MTAKGVLFFFLLLLSCGISFSFPSDEHGFIEQELAIDSFEFDEETAELYTGTIPFFKTIIFQDYSLVGGRSFVFRSSFATKSQKEYIKRSKEIEPGLDAPDIIYPFHIFL